MGSGIFRTSGKHAPLAVNRIPNWMVCMLHHFTIDGENPPGMRINGPQLGSPNIGDCFLGSKTKKGSTNNPHITQPNHICFGSAISGL